MSKFIPVSVNQDFRVEDNIEHCVIIEIENGANVAAVRKLAESVKRNEILDRQLDEFGKKYKIYNYTKKTPALLEEFLKKNIKGVIKVHPAEDIVYAAYTPLDY